MWHGSWRRQWLSGCSVWWLARSCTSRWRALWLRCSRSACSPSPLAAFLYSSVGHAGASGYIATMTLFGLAPMIIRPTALVLNILVASIGTFQFWRAGHFSWKLFWPFALLSIPAAYIGGYLQPSASVFRILIGVVLLFSAPRRRFLRSDLPPTSTPSRPVAISVVAGLGFLSGLTGTECAI